jgi:Na+/H+ antiporter NhaD/arsenite permease-like protein
MIPIIKGILPSLPPGFHGDPNALWWSLALGACLGANGTMIGSAANMVVIGISKKSGFNIAFWDFAKKGLPVTIASLVISSLYVWIRYFLLFR